MNTEHFNDKQVQMLEIIKSLLCGDKEAVKETLKTEDGVLSMEELAEVGIMADKLLSGDED